MGGDKKEEMQSAYSPDLSVLNQFSTQTWSKSPIYGTDESSKHQVGLPSSQAYYRQMMF